MDEGVKIQEDGNNLRFSVEECRSALAVEMSIAFHGHHGHCESHQSMTLERGLSEPMKSQKGNVLVAVLSLIELRTSHYYLLVVSTSTVLIGR